MATIFKHDGPMTREEQLANTVPVFKHPAQLTDAQLGDMRDECKRLGGRPLTDAERDKILNLTPEQRPSTRTIEVDE